MGVLAHRLACLTVRSSPNRHERKFSSIHICRVTFKHLPQPLWSYILSFETLWQLFKIPPFSAQKSHSARGRGVPKILFWVGILIVLLLRSPCKIAKPYNNHFWENEQWAGREKERKREKNAIYSGHLRLCQQQRAAHALRSDQYLNDGL